MTTGIVVGSGPNGLAGAVTLARAGVDVTVLEAADRIGGGARSGAATLPGLLHDECSASFPLGAGSPYLQTLDLARHGLVYRWGEVDLAHPLASGEAGVLTRSVAQSADTLGTDGPEWQRLFGPLAASYDALAPEVMGPLLHPPRHVVPLARFGLRALQPAAVTARRWRGDAARGLFAGCAAHAFRPLGRPATSAIGMMLIMAGHRYGWPVVQGGSGALTAALAAALIEYGGRIETGAAVRALDELPRADVVLLDLSPGDVVLLAGDRLPRRVRTAYSRYRHGPGAYKLDLAVEGGIPWTNSDCRRAATVHVGGTLEEIDYAERAVLRGRMPRRPFVLVGQQYLADPGRSDANVHPVWAYAHAPSGYDEDATDLVLAQIERFAPGLRDRIVAHQAVRPAEWPARNANYVGGDIATGANTAWQLLFRPRPAVDPYRTGIPGVFLCSAATPPGAGVHGMCGHHAARSALRSLR